MGRTKLGNGSDIFCKKTPEPSEATDDQNRAVRDDGLDQKNPIQADLKYIPITAEVIEKFYDRVCEKYQRNLEAGLFQESHIL